MKTQVTETAPGTNKLVKATEFMLGYDSTISVLWILKKINGSWTGGQQDTEETERKCRDFMVKVLLGEWRTQQE